MELISRICDQQLQLEMIDTTLPTWGFSRQYQSGRHACVLAHGGIELNLALGWRNAADDVLQRSPKRGRANRKIRQTARKSKVSHEPVA